MLTPLDSSIFSSVAGLPVHPLVVHFAVVLLPLAALGLVVLVAVPRWADRFGPLTLAALAVGTAAAFVAKESGESLAAQVGEPRAHALWGDQLPLLAVGLLAVALAWYLLHRRAGGRRSVASGVAGGVAALLAVAVIAVTVVVGHSGAQAAWGGVASGQGDGAAAESVPDSTPSASGTSDGSASASASAGAGSYSLADVAKHGDASSCWSVVNGSVYDLTDWITQHPGGARRILGMCGQDGTAAFEGQHQGQGRAEKALAGFRIGTLA